ncbi:MAG: isochorismatase family protein [Planctomycetaceae bacterium]|nr:isochorismatase family protein [Planctomycetaceae bacterium]
MKVIQSSSGHPEISRRRFVSLSAGAALALAGDPGVQAQPALAGSDHNNDALLHVQPRYYRWHVDPGVEWLEANTDYAQLDWTIPVHQAALVLVDVWDRHYLKDAEARAEAIINEKFVPLLAGARSAGLPIIHAPSPPHAMRHPNWIGAGTKPQRSAPPDDWPPAEFRGKSGRYSVYARPAEAREAELSELRSHLQIHPRVLPAGDEPVVATGDELHHVCSRNGILFLIYAGFNTNACILMRDYGTLAMTQRGYEVLLLRDCTTGMESRQSLPTLSQTNGAILLLEMFGQYSLTSDELLAGLKAGNG